MKIGLDCSVTNTNQAGTSIYVRSLAEYIRKATLSDELCTFSLPYTQLMGKRKTWKTRARTLYQDLIWTQMVFPWFARRQHTDVLHFPANVMSFFSSRPTVVTIHDVTPFTQPSNFSGWHRIYHRFLVPLTAQRASHIIAVSKSTKNDLIRLFRISPERVTVVYEAARPSFGQVPTEAVKDIQAKYGLGPFILTVGTLEPRKNLVKVLEAFSVLRSRGITHSLVHVGPSGWSFDDVFAAVAQMPEKDAVRFLGYVPEEDLTKLYNAASVFVYPSLYEGFGLPLVEAMACGCPVVTSDLSSMPEIVGNAAVTVNPSNASQIADAIQSIIESKSVAQRMSSDGLTQARFFSWQKCAEETLAVYHRVAR